MKISGRYLGDKKVELKHEQSGSVIKTAAPKDNQGDGSTFSPTDLLAASLGACAMTIMGIYAERHGIDLSGMTMELEKHMQSSPRRVGALPVKIHLPEGISAEDRGKLEAAANTCPVKKSLHPEIEIEIELM